MEPSRYGRELVRKLNEQRRLSSAYCDVDLLTKGGGREVAHKSVLGAKSRHFNKLFMKDESLKSVSIDLNFETLSVLLDYMYEQEDYDVGSITPGNVSSLLEGAALLKLEGFEEFVGKIIARELDPKSALLMLKSADCENANLRSACSEAIVNNWAQLETVKEFQALTSKQVETIILKAKSRNVDSGNCIQLLLVWMKRNVKDRKDTVREIMKHVPIEDVDNTILDAVLHDSVCQTLVMEPFLSVGKAAIGKLKRLQSTNTEGNPPPKRKMTEALPTVSNSVVSKSASSGRKQAVSNGKGQERKARKNEKPVKAVSPPSESLTYSEEIVEIDAGTAEPVKDTELYFCSSTGPTLFLWNYNMKENRCRQVSQMPDARLNCSIAYHGEVLYVIGGTSKKSSDSLSSVLVYDVTDKNWLTDMPNMKESRSYFQNVVLGNYLYAIGGSCVADGEPGTINCVEKIALDGENRQWEETDYLKHSRDSFGVGVVAGNIYVMGGYVAGDDGECVASNSVESYDPVKDQWKEEKPMPTKRAGSCAAVMRNTIYAIGGGPQVGDKTKVVEIYDVVKKEWKTGVPMLKSRQYASAFTVGHEIFVVGGDNKTYPTVEKFNTLTQQWIQMTSARIRAGDFGSVALKV